MKNKITKFCFGITTFWFCLNSVQADKMVFKFKNPSFGGQSYNGQILLASAQAQNDHEEEKDPVKEFQDQLRSQVFYRLSREIIDTIFDKNGEIKSGNYKIGDYNININSDMGDIGIEISSPDGSVTAIEIPRI